MNEIKTNMIISFNPTIFQTQDDDMQSILADILVELLKDNHFIEPKSIKSVFFDNDNKYIFNENKIAQIYLSVNKKQNLKDYIYKKISQPITKLYINHLTHLTIGNNLGELQPADAYIIITERSKIIVENSINDGKFIRCICQKYSSSKINRKSIYLLVDKAIKQGILELDHAGGVGAIASTTQRWIDDPRYDHIYKYKLMTIFDSDKTHIHDFQKTTHKTHINLIEYLKNISISDPPTKTDISYDEDNDLIRWHILYKRKIENYLPLCILFDKVKSMTENQKNDLRNTTKEDLDFIEYNYYNIGIGEATIKREIPEMFLSNFSYNKLEQRCEHHKVEIELPNGTTEEVSEIEQILLKIAKIV